MRKLPKHLRESYQRCRERLIGEHDPYAGSSSIGIDDVLRAHYLLCEYFLEEGEAIALAGPRSDDLLVSAIGRQETGYNGICKWNDPLQKCATLFFGLIKNHPFHDGNKRTALLTALYHLHKLGRTPDVKQRALEVLSVRTAANRLSEYPQFPSREQEDREVYFIANFFKKNTRRRDNRFYKITYNQLRVILNSFGFELSNPSGNYIDVVCIEEKKSWLGKSRKVTKKVLQVGFPGWTKQVNAKAINSVRQATKLTGKHGVDSQAFYRDADPLVSLIGIYHAPLRRLKDR